VNRACRALKAQRVEELRRLCVNLRQRLTQARETQSRLADALVAELA
jgi:hypothetical protein